MLCPITAEAWSCGTQVSGGLTMPGAFGAARTIGYALQAGTPIYAAPSKAFLESGKTEPGEAHSAYHEYLFKLKRVRERLYTEPARRLGEQRHRILWNVTVEVGKGGREQQVPLHYVEHVEVHKMTALAEPLTDEQVGVTPVP